MTTDHGYDGVEFTLQGLLHLMNERDTRYQVQFELRDKAMVLMTDNLKSHLDQLNHYRELELRNQASFLTKENYDRSHQSLADKIDSLNSRLNVILGIAIMVSLIASIIGYSLGHALKVIP